MIKLSYFCISNPLSLYVPLHSVETAEYKKIQILALVVCLQLHVTKKTNNVNHNYIFKLPCIDNLLENPTNYKLLVCHFRYYNALCQIQKFIRYACKYLHVFCRVPIINSRNQKQLLAYTKHVYRCMSSRLHNYELRVTEIPVRQIYDSRRFVVGEWLL